MVCRQGKLRHEVMIRSGSFREAVMLHQCLGLDQSNPKNRAIPKKKPLCAILLVTLPGPWQAEQISVLSGG